MQYLKRLAITLSVAAIALAVIGCSMWPVKTTSPTVPNTQVSRPELDAELKGVQAKFEAAYTDLSEKERIRAVLASVFAKVGTVVVPGEYSEILAGLLTLTTLAAGADAVKNRVGSRSDRDDTI